MAKIKNDFYDTIDNIFVLNKDALEGKGEDSFYCARTKKSVIVSVYDGTGGLGSRMYPSFENQTGAYMASRIVSGAVRDWYKKYNQLPFSNVEEIVQSMRSYIEQGYKICESHAVTNNRIRGSMVRDFPTTLAMAIAQPDKNGVLVHVIWAGDSRVYLMDKRGLAQLTKDDIDDEDAFTNLFNDGVMTNLLSSDGKYEIHGKTILVQEPTVIFAATDGCFGYLSTPMEFEYLILQALMNAQNPEYYQNNLIKAFTNIAGDDYTFGNMEFNFGEFKDVKESFKDRYQFLQTTYIDPINDGDREDLDFLASLWEKYKVEYERYID